MAERETEYQILAVNKRDAFLTIIHLDMSVVATQENSSIGSGSGGYNMS